MPMHIGERIRRRRTEKGLDRAELARRAGIPYSTLAGIENGSQGSSPRMWRVAEELGCTIEWLETGKGDAELEVSVAADGEAVELVFVDKVSGAQLSAGSGEVLWDFEQIDKSHAFRLDWMQAKGLKADKCKVWTVRGESMEPKYPGGSWVLINMAERTPVHGKNFALIGDDGLRLKQLRRTASGGWEMYSLNPDKDRFPTEPIIDDNYAIIGRVRGHGGDDD